MDLIDAHAHLSFFDSAVLDAIFAGAGASGVRAWVLAGYDERDVERLMADAGIVRNRRKIDATITNARATVELRADGGLAELVWSFRPAETPAPSTYAEVPTTSPESVALSKELKRRGFTFVGSTICYAFMQATGMVDDHLAGCFRSAGGR